MAQQVFYDAFVDCAARVGSYRNEDGRLACILGNLRQRARTAAPSAIEGRGIERAFSTLSEEERAALAGLYTRLLPARVLAEALKMSLEQMGRVLRNGRERLSRASLELGKPSMEQAL